ncbi:MAG: acyl-CoA dehydrogenase family protein, partial [Sphingomonadales bacterium]|nr:acyl-CoA dehydrogenase family protein [Sphingomonadales bacterium]
MDHRRRQRGSAAQHPVRAHARNAARTEELGAVMIERAELHDAAQKAFPADQLRPARDASWELIAEMGWLLLPLPEDAGGLGLGRDAATAIHFELGKVLSTAPLLPALLTVQALASAEELTDRSGWIERVTAGEFVTVNLLPAELELATSGSIRLSGTLPCTPDADLASHMLVVTKNIAVLVPLDGEGVTLT